MSENYRVETNTYPIYEVKERIIETIQNNPVSIIVAETGAGKSTQVPQFLIDNGFDSVVITVPSRTAATSLAERVANERKSTIGDVVGYQTAYERALSPETQILFTTEGLQLIKELNDDEGNPNKVLIIDELQEWSINVEALIAFLKLKIQNGFKSKIVLMSATMDERIAEFFDDAPIVRVAGRLFPIEEYISNDMQQAIIELANKGRNVLAFVAGKYEISQFTRTLRKLENFNASIFPLHADLSLEDQHAVFEPTNNPKIVVATNVAQTSITIPDIDAVVDSGLERHMEIIDGLETLTIGNISKSDMIQRKGRAGRTKRGVYVWCGEIATDELQEHSTPDILTGNITEIVLKLASAGIDADDLKFFHQPPTEKIQEAKKSLRTLGAFDSENVITETGEIMAMLPISAKFSRMIVEAAKRDVLEDVLTIAAIQECGGLKLSNVPYGKFSRELTSDLLADLDCFNSLRKALKDSNWPMCVDTNPFDGINKRNYYRIMELRVKLSDVLYKIYDDIYSTGNRKQIALSCAAGLVEHLYIRQNNAWYYSASDDSRRKLDKCSCALAQKMVLGIPKNISLYGRAAEAETQVLYLICNAMVVDIDMLKEVAPHLVHVKEHIVCDPNNNRYSCIEDTYFGENIIESKEYAISDVNEKRSQLASWLALNTLEQNPENDPKLNKVLKLNKKKYFGLPDRQPSGSIFNELKNGYIVLLRRRAQNSVPSMAKAKNYQLLQL